MLYRSIAALSVALGIAGAMTHAPLNVKLLFASFVAVSVVAIAFDRAERPEGSRRKS